MYYKVMETHADSLITWLVVEEAPDYEVPSNGLVRSYKPIRNYAIKSATPHTIKPSLDKNGYTRVTLANSNKKLYRRVCRLVCEAFNGPPKGGCSKAS